MFSAGYAIGSSIRGRFGRPILIGAVVVGFLGSGVWLSAEDWYAPVDNPYSDATSPATTVLVCSPTPAPGCPETAP